MTLLDRPYLQPEPETPTRPTGSSNDRTMVRTYLVQRTVVGFIGLALPLVLLFGDGLLLDGAIDARGSLSAYYHSGMRDVFVGALVLAAAFLFSYKLFKAELDNTLSIVAGLSALGVALFPTGLPSGSTAQLTPLQDRLDEGTVSFIHVTAAVIFIGSLAGICFLFGKREGDRPQTAPGRDSARGPRFWRRYHFTAAAVIVLAMILMALSKGFDVWDEHSTLIGETLALWAFGASWFMKGLERDVLRN